MSLYIKYILCSHLRIRSLSLQDLILKNVDVENCSNERTTHRMNIFESITFDVIVETNCSNCKENYNKSDSTYKIMTQDVLHYNIQDKTFHRNQPRQHHYANTINCVRAKLGEKEKK